MNKNKINQEIAVLFPFKNKLTKSYSAFEARSGGKLNIKQIKALLPMLNHKYKRIDELFHDLSVVYGNTALGESQIGKIKKLALKKKKIVFHIAGFPHKMPNSFFTSNKLPDLGELAYLWRLEQIAIEVEKLTGATVEMMVCLEGTVFHFLAMVSKFEAQTYQDKVSDLVKIFKLNHLHPVDLASLHCLVLDWDKKVRLKALEIQKAYQKGKLKIIEQVKRVWPVMFVTLNVRGWPDAKIKQLFWKSNKLSDQRGVWAEFANYALDSTFDYLAYNEVKRNSNLMNLAFPDAIKLTVTPKKNAIGIWWVKQEIEKLPYYGVPIVKNGKFYDIEYQYDLKDKKLKYYYFPGFAEKFFYVLNTTKLITE